jgi:hypothetical protein
MSIELKIKSKHLGLEAKVIKFEEAKLKQQLRWMRKHQESVQKLEWKLQSITSHRKHEVRNENRATFLARAFIAGVPYKTVEHKVKDHDKRNCYVVPRVLSMVKKYHSWKIELADIQAWINA